MNLTALCPKDEEVWVTYYKKDELLFFLTGPSGMPSTLAAQSGKFTLYGVSTGARGAQKAKKLGQGGNPTELEAKYSVADGELILRLKHTEEGVEIAADLLDSTK